MLQRSAAWGDVDQHHCPSITPSQTHQTARNQEFGNASGPQLLEAIASVPPLPRVAASRCRKGAFSAAAVVEGTANQLRRSRLPAAERCNFAGGCRDLQV